MLFQRHYKRLFSFVCTVHAVKFKQRYGFFFTYILFFLSQHKSVFFLPLRFCMLNFLMNSSLVAGANGSLVRFHTFNRVSKREEKHKIAFGAPFITLASCSFIYSVLNSRYSTFYARKKCLRLVDSFHSLVRSISLFYFPLALCTNDNDEAKLHSLFRKLREHC